MKPKFTMIMMLLALGVQMVFAQQKTVSGTVSDKNGLPLPGATVIRAGTSSGTTTDFDGKYQLSANVGDVLEISYVGYATQSVTVGASSTYDVQMQTDNTLDEVVVTGYTSQKKSDVTGSIVSVGEEEIQSLVTATVDQALQGKVSGLAITSNSGTPGSTSQIRIRGISSITAGNEPLYVIDGVPVNNDNVSNSSATSFLSSVAGLDSNNIKSVTVLKDASSTSQYGARGANGVILITTKDGQQGKTRFSFTSSYGLQNDAVEGPVPLTAAQRLELHAEAYFNDGYYPTTEDATAYLLNTSTYKSWDEDGRPEANWKEIIRNPDAPIYQANFSASGGNEGHTFYTSLGYMEQEGTVIGSSFERISGAINFNKSISEKLEFSTKNSASYSYQDAFLERSAYFEGARSSIFFQSPLRQPYTRGGEINQFGGSLPNPLYISKENINDNRYTRLMSNNTLRWNVNDRLVLGSRFNVDYQIYNARTYSNRNYGYGAPTQGDAGQYMRNNAFYVFQNFLEYNFEINPDHVFDFTLLQEYQSNRLYYLGAFGQNFPDDGLFNLDNLGKIVSANSSVNDFYQASYLGLLSYKLFDSRYVLNLSYRREGSSLFSKKNRWGDFWSVGGAWNLDREPFLADSNVINTLKLRASYGTTGNSQIRQNQFQALFAFDGAYAGEGAQDIDTFGNEDLSWEKNTTLDLGLDFVLLDNLFTGSIGYFNRDTSDLLLNVPLSLTSGFSSQTRNVGAVNNKGIEAELTANIIQSDDLNLSIGGNVSSIQNEVTKLELKPDGTERTITTTTTKIESGHPIREWFMPTWAGVNPQTGEEEWYINGVDGAKTTNFNDAERVYQGGNAIPKVTAGLNFHVDFKGFFLDASTYYAGGHKVYEGWHRYTNQPNGFTFAFQGLSSLLDRWQKPGDIARNGKYTSGFTPWERHSKYLYDGDFLRLRTAQLGYDFKDKFEHLGITNLRVFFKGNNLLTWVKDKNLHYDPEVDLGGETGLETPPSKSVSFGLTLNF